MTALYVAARRRAGGGRDRIVRGCLFSGGALAVDREEGVRTARSAGHDLGEPFCLEVCCCENGADPEAHACIHCPALLAVVPATGEVDEVYTEPAVFGWWLVRDCGQLRQLAQRRVDSLPYPLLSAADPREGAAR